MKYLGQNRNVRFLIEQKHNRWFKDILEELIVGEKLLPWQAANRLEISEAAVKYWVRKYQIPVPAYKEDS